MTNATRLDPADRTPIVVLNRMASNTKAYPRDQCLPCGAVIKKGFFFEGFGRHCVHDKRGSAASA
jgi:hypothetical protein